MLGLSKLPEISSISDLGMQSLSQNQVFLSLYLGNLMVKTFDLSSNLGHFSLHN